MKNRLKLLLHLLIILSPFLCSITQAAGEIDNTFNKIISFMLYFTIVLIIFVLWLTLVYSDKNDNNGDIFRKLWRSFLLVINPMPPLEKENDILLTHNYDEILELDNVVPPWFSFLFYGTILFGLIYILNFHVFDKTWSQEREYSEEVEVARLQRQVLLKTGAFIDENSVVILADAITLVEGKDIYKKNCISCHGAFGEGLVGPNLTDDYWINGGGIKNIFKTIKNGVPAKGMITWQTQLNPKQIQSVSNFILKLKGSNPSNAKAKEGVLWVEPEENTSNKNVYK